MAFHANVVQTSLMPLEILCLLTVGIWFPNIVGLIPLHELNIWTRAQMTVFSSSLGECSDLVGAGGASHKSKVIFPSQTVLLAHVCSFYIRFNYSIQLQMVLPSKSCYSLGFQIPIME